MKRVIGLAILLALILIGCSKAEPKQESVAVVEEKVEYTETELIARTGREIENPMVTRGPNIEEEAIMPERKVRLASPKVSSKKVDADIEEDVKEKVVVDTVSSKKPIKYDAVESQSRMRTEEEEEKSSNMGLILGLLAILGIGGVVFMKNKA